jgi:hypothetical protein
MNDVDNYSGTMKTPSFGIVDQIRMTLPLLSCNKGPKSPPLLEIDNPNRSPKKPRIHSNSEDVEKEVVAGSSPLEESDTTVSECQNPVFKSRRKSKSFKENPLALSHLLMIWHLVLEIWSPVLEFGCSGNAVSGSFKSDPHSVFRLPKKSRV